jgi:hypothetical protein
VSTVTSFSTLPVGSCWLDPYRATDSGRWVVQSADGLVSDAPAPATRRRLDGALALLAAEPRLRHRGEPTVQRAEVYEDRPVTAPGHLYLRVSVTGTPGDGVEGEEFWVCAGPVPGVDWQLGLVVVGEPD